MSSEHQCHHARPCPDAPHLEGANTLITSACRQATDTLAERLRRRPAKPMGSPRVGSNLTGVVCLWSFFIGTQSLKIQVYIAPDKKRRRPTKAWMDMRPARATTTETRGSQNQTQNPQRSQALEFQRVSPKRRRRLACCTALLAEVHTALRHNTRTVSPPAWARRPVHHLQELQRLLVQCR